MTTLVEAFAKLRSDESLEEQFKADPIGLLGSLGVDTSKLKVSQRPTPTGTNTSAATAEGCWSVGCVGCYSSG